MLFDGTLTPSTWSSIPRASSIPWWNSWTIPCWPSSAILTCAFPFSTPSPIRSGPPRNRPPLDLVEIGTLDFSAPDHERFPCLGYAIEAGKAGGTMPCVLNAANEAAVQAFLAGRIGFMDIPETVEATMAAHQHQALESLEQVLEVNRWARDFAQGLINRESSASRRSLGPGPA